MTVYVDELFNTRSLKSAQWQYNQSCHMKADTEAELDQMALAIGLKRQWCQFRENPVKRHYDLTASKRALAVRHGAVQLTCREMVELTKRARDQEIARQQEQETSEHLI